MLNEEHRLWTPPTDDFKIWRYMSLAKFLWTLATEQLWFAGLEELAKTDPHEGGLALPDYKHRRVKRVENLSASDLLEVKIGPSRKPQDRQTAFQIYRIEREYVINKRERYRKAMFVNCWHMNPDESAAMWATYAPGCESIALRSTYKKLSKCLDETPEEIVPAAVDYKDFLKEAVIDSGLSRYAYPVAKRLNFAHEHELRLIYVDKVVARSELQDDKEHSRAIYQTRMGEDGRTRPTTVEDYNFESRSSAKPAQAPGNAVKVKSKELVDQIRIAPNAAKWFHVTVCEVASRFGLDPSIVVPSEITSERFK